MRSNALGSKPDRAYSQAMMALKTLAAEEGPLAVCRLFADLMAELLEEKRASEEPADQRLRGVADWIRRRGGAVTSRELQKSKVAGVKSSKEAKRLLQELAHRGLVSFEPRGKTVVARLVDEPSTGGGRNGNENPDDV
ncbi:MAG TPA: hypothetical protein GX517_00560 [Alicyclobacillus sp.]|nr:hypothetical protein [Alicyclobacillus sp.]